MSSSFKHFNNVLKIKSFHSSSNQLRGESILQGDSGYKCLSVCHLYKILGSFQGKLSKFKFLIVSIRLDSSVVSAGFKLLSSTFSILHCTHLISALKELLLGLREHLYPPHPSRS